MALQNSNDDKSLGIIADRPQIIQGTPGQFDDPRNIPPGYRLSANGVDLERIPVEPEGTGPDIVFGDPPPIEEPATVRTEPDTSGNFLFSSAQAAEGAPQQPEFTEKEREAVRQTIQREEGWQPDKTGAQFDVYLSKVGPKQFAKELTENINMLVDGVGVSSTKRNLYDPNTETLKRLLNEDPGTKWHYGIPLIDWARAMAIKDPDERAAAKKELLRNRLRDMNIGESIYGRNILATTEPGIFNTEDIGWDGSQFYTQPTIGERVVVSSEEMGKAFVRSIYDGIPKALVSLNEFGGLAYDAVSGGPSIGVAYVRDAIEELLNMTEEGAISHAQQKTQEFLDSLQLTAEENEYMRQWLDAKAYDWGLTDIFGERFSGGTISTRLVEEAVPFLLTLALPIGKATQLVRLAKTRNIAHRLFLQKHGLSEFVDGGIDRQRTRDSNRLRELLTKQRRGDLEQGPILGKAEDQKNELIELQTLKARSRLLRDVTPSELAYSRRWTHEIVDGKPVLSEQARREIANTEYMLELGAAGGMTAAAALYGEDHWVSFLAPMLGGLTAVHNMGQTIEGVANSSIYSLRSMEYAVHRALAISGIPGSEENMQRVAIKMFGLQNQAERKMREKAMSKARTQFQSGGDRYIQYGKVNSDKRVIEIIKRERAEYERLINIPDGQLSATQKARKEELRETSLDLDGKNWQDNIEGLNLQELTEIVGNRPSKIKQLRRTAQIIVDQMGDEPGAKAAFLQKIQEAQRVAVKLQQAMEDRNIIGPNEVADGSSVISLYLENFITSSALAHVSKELLSRGSVGMNFDVAKGLKLWSSYWKMQKEQDRSLKNIKSLLTNILDPLEEADPDIRQFKETVDTVLTRLTADATNNRNTATEILNRLSKKMRNLVTNERLLEEVEKGHNIRQILRLDALSDPKHARHKIAEINTIMSEYLQNLAKPHRALYNELKNDVGWTMALPAGNVGAELLDMSDEFFPLMAYEARAGTTPPSVQIVELVKQARRESLYRLAGGSDDRSARGIPLGFSNPEQFYSLVEDLLQSGEWVDQPIKIIKPGGRQTKVVLSRSKLNSHLKQLEEIRNIEAVDAEGAPLEGADLAAFNRRKLEAEANHTASFIEDILYVPSAEIPMEVSLDVLDKLRSNITRLAHKNQHNRKGVRYKQLEEIIDGIGEDGLDALDNQGDLFDTTKLTATQKRNIQTWRDAREKYREYKRTLGGSLGAEVTREGKQASKYTYRPSEVQDEMGNIDMLKVSMFNPWEKVFISPEDTDRTAMEFYTAFADPQTKKVPLHHLQLLLDSAGMYMNKGHKLPAGWWKSYQGMFKDSGMNVKDYGVRVKEWEDFNAAFQVAQRKGEQGLSVLNAKQFDRDRKDWEATIEARADKAKQQLSDLYNRIKSDEDKSIIEGLQKLLKLDTSEKGEEHIQAIDLLFSRRPTGHFSKQIYDSIDYKPEDVDALVEVGRDWPPQVTYAPDFVEEPQDLVGMVLGKYARSQESGTRYVPPVEDLFRILDEAVANKDITRSQRQTVIDTLRNYYSVYLADAVFKRTNEKTLLGSRGREVAESVDIEELTRILQNEQSTLRYLYDEDEVKLINESLGMIYDIGGKIRDIDNTTGIPRSATMESLLARGFALTRGVVSWRWVIGEQTIKHRRLQSIKQLQDLIQDPTSLSQIEAIMIKDPRLITKEDVQSWKTSFSHLLPGAIAKNLTLEYLRDEVEAYQEELDLFKKSYGIPEAFRPNVTNYFGRPGLHPVRSRAKLRGDLEQLVGRAQMERLLSQRRGATPATDPRKLEERAARRRQGIEEIGEGRPSEQTFKYGGALHNQMQRLLN